MRQYQLAVAMAVALLPVTMATTAVVRFADFPFVRCDALIAPFAYRLHEEVTHSGNNTYCFKLKVDLPPAGCSSYCCTTADLKKLEINVNPECDVSGARVKATLNSVPTKVPTIEGAPMGPPGSTILRLTKLGLNSSTANGAEICITLGTNKDGKGCTTLGQLCMQQPRAAGTADMDRHVCTTALFDTLNDCCQINTVNVDTTFLTGPSSPSLPNPAIPTSPELPSSHSMPTPGLPPPAPYIPPCNVCIHLRYVGFSPYAPDINGYHNRENYPPASGWDQDFEYSSFLPPPPPSFEVYDKPILFSAELCAAFSYIINQNLTESAKAVGASIMTAFQVRECNDLSLKVCGEFASDADGVKLAPDLGGLMNQWSGMMSNRLNTAPYFCRDVTLEVLVGGDGIDIEGNGTSPSCLVGDFLFSYPCIPPTVSFPTTCQCNKNAGSTPFAAKSKISTRQGRKSTNTLYCFEITVVTPKSTGQCSKANVLYKVEIYADYNHRAKISGIGVQPAGATSMKYVAPVWGSADESAVNAAPLNWTVTQANGAKVCLELDKSTSIDSFCEGPVPSSCWLSFHNMASCPDKDQQPITSDYKYCCPLYMASIPLSSLG